MSDGLFQRLRLAAGILRRGSQTYFNRVSDLGSPQSEQLTQPYAQSVWVMRAIKKVASPIAAIPLEHYRGEVEVQSPELTTWWQQPCPRLSYPDFVEALVGWLKLKGEAFIILDDAWLAPFPSQPYGNQVLLARPDKMRHVLQDGVLTGWVWTLTGGKQIALVPEQVIQLAFWNPDDPYRGAPEYAPAAMAAEADYLAGRFNKNLMANNGDTGPIIVGKGGVPTDTQREQIVSQLRMKRSAQLRGDFRPIFLSGDITIEDPQIRTPDANFISTRLHNRHEIFIAFGVPPSMADVVASYSIGSASDRFMLIEETCQPLSRKLGEAFSLIDQKLTGQPVQARFDWDEHSTMQQVRHERIDAATKLWDRGLPWETVNEYLDLGMVEFPGWDQGYLPFGLAPVDLAAEPVESPLTSPEYAEDTDDDEATADLRSLFAGRARKSVLTVTTDSVARAKADRRRAQWLEAMRQRRTVMRAYQTKFNRVLMQARAETLANLEAAAGAKAVFTKAGAASYIFGLEGFTKNLIAGLNDVALKALDTAGQQLFDEVGKADPWKTAPLQAKNFLRTRENKISGAAAGVHQQIMSAIEDAIESGESLDGVADAVRTRFNWIQKDRALVIAQTETAAAYGYARDKAMHAAGIQWKQWLSSRNDNVRPAHEEADGQIVSTDEPFIVGGERLEFPGDPNGSAGNVINCNCVQIAVESEDDTGGRAPADCVVCQHCGCTGNSNCGHQPLDPERCCTLGPDGFCPCCRLALQNAPGRAATLGRLLGSTQAPPIKMQSTSGEMQDGLENLEEPAHE